MVGLLKIAFETGPSISIYEIWHYTYVGALPIPKHYPCHSITILEHYPYRSITIPGHYYPCQSITHTEALPMPEHNNVQAYQCWSIPISEHTKEQCCLQPLVAFIHFGTEQTTPSPKLLYIHILLYKPSGCYFNRQIALVRILITFVVTLSCRTYILRPGS